MSEENMTTYIGTKTLKAKPMNRGDYNSLRRWPTTEDENPNDEGYLVIYLDGDISWSPKDVFERHYNNSSNGLCFSLALSAIKKGYKVSRHGWNGADQFVFLVHANEWECDPDLDMHDLADQQRLPFICLKNAQGAIVPWLASQGDMMAEDWFIIE